ncbi:hypothetical protein ACRAQ7_00230 [Erythrobacter sp. W53]|uniref:hypothetical protein n=1 Tax=Erythrobacter sp. W53 TaxID=3425947 RepID=UPI003D769BB0
MANTVVEAIVELEEIQSKLSQTVSQGGEMDARELTKLRSSFSMGLLRLGTQARDDSAFASDRDRLAAFNSRHREVQNELSRHQAEWMLSKIAEQPENYRDATQKLKINQQDFFVWTKQQAS